MKINNFKSLITVLLKLFIVNKNTQYSSHLVIPYVFIIYVYHAITSLKAFPLIKDYEYEVLTLTVRINLLSLYLCNMSKQKLKILVTIISIIFLSTTLNRTWCAKLVV